MPSSSPRNPLVWPVLAIAVLGISAGGVLARLAHEADPVVIAFWRVGLCGVLLLPALVIEKRPSLRDLGTIGLGGALLAAHFWTWFESLEHISVMRSVVLVTLAPIWVGLGEWLFFRERPAWRYWAGTALALSGVLVMAGADAGGAALKGDVLALVGGVFSSSYLLIGRSVRRRVAFASYGALVCLASALVLLLIALIRGLPLAGFEASTWGALVALALIPQMLGHMGFNYALGFVSASLIAALVLLEPVGATALAAVVLDEWPRPVELLGGAIILAGVGAATLRLPRG